MSSFKSKCLALISTMKLEPFIALYFAGYTVKSLTVTQLIQDKLCMNEYNYSIEFCKSFNASSPSLEKEKSKILIESSQYQIYQSLVSTVPIMLTVLFAGSWIDKNAKIAFKLFGFLAAVGALLEAGMLILNALEFHWQASMVLLSFIPSSAIGSYVFMLMAAYSYVPQTTPEPLRPIRFAFLDFSFLIGQTLGQYLGGVMLQMKPIGRHSLHNYVGVFIVSIMCHFKAILWLFFAFSERKRDSLIDEEIIAEPVETENALDQSEQSANVFSGMFHCRNALETLKTCFKKRPNSGRTQLWILIIALYIVDVIGIGQSSIEFQFVEGAYGWNATKYSYVSALANVYNSITMALLTYILVRKIKTGELLLAVIGVVSATAAMIIKGSILIPAAYVLSVIVGSPMFMSFVGLKSAISNLIDKEEAGKVFSIITVLESTIKVVSTFIFTITLKLVIHKQPGLLYEYLAFAFLLPLFAIVFVELIYWQKRDNEDNFSQITDDNTVIIQHASINECDA